MKKIMFVAYLFLHSLSLMAHIPEKINFHISLSKHDATDNHNFDHTIAMLSDIVHRKEISTQETAAVLQLLVFLTVHQSPYQGKVTLEIDGHHIELPFTYELFMHLIEPEMPHETVIKKRPQASSSFLQGYPDIE